MRLHSLILTLTLAAVCVGAEPAPTPRANEPTYEGKIIGEWKALTRDKNANIRAQATEALGNSLEAKAAVPALAEMLKDRDWKVRRTAIEALGKIGPEAKAAVPVDRIFVLLPEK